MSIRFCSFSSGSSGNCYLIASDKTKLILDVGIPGRDIFDRLDSCGIKPEEVDGIFITHEHTDHSKSLRMISRATGATVFSTQGTLDSLKDKLSSQWVALPREMGEVEIGDIKVETFPLSHDAVEPVGYSFSQGDFRITVLTDTGKVTREQRRFLLDSDVIAMEANHETNLLMYCNYPFTLKRRILSEVGHLSNEAAAECLIDILSNRTKKTRPIFALSHISKESNSPEIASITIENLLAEKGFLRKEHYVLTVFHRNKKSEIIEY